MNRKVETERGRSRELEMMSVIYLIKSKEENKGNIQRNDD